MLPQAAWVIALCAPTVLGFNILLTNGDGWAVSTIRAQFEALNRSEYDVILSAPADNRSGTSSNTTTPTPRIAPCEFDTCPAGAPAEGFDATNPRFNYVNGYPVDAAKYGIQTLSPKFFGGPPDFVVSGPNVGLNTGPTVNISGTVGAAVEAAREGLFAIAISADGNSTAQIPYTRLTSEPDSNLTKSAEVYSNLTIKFLAELLKYGLLEVLPKNTILNLNYPGTANCPTVDSFKFVFARMNEHENAADLDLNMCKRTRLPTENTVIGSGCYVSVSLVNATNKADASVRTQVELYNRLQPLFSCLP